MLHLLRPKRWRLDWAFEAVRVRKSSQLSTVKPLSKIRGPFLSIELPVSKKGATGLPHTVMFLGQLGNQEAPLHKATPFNIPDDAVRDPGIYAIPEERPECR